MLKTTIMGFGFAGLHLHYKCLRKMLYMGWENVLFPEITVIDSSELGRANAEGKTIRYQLSLEPISHREANYHVLHICSPPDVHFENLKAALECGYRQIIVEKPVVSNMEELRQVQALQNYYGANILVVANWVCSTLVESITDKLRQHQLGEIKHVIIVQNKSRFCRSRGRTGEHVYDIEMPHQISLSLFLNGPAKPLAATVTDMILPDRVIPELGSGNVLLRHNNGVISELKSSLVHTVRERHVEIETELGYRLRGYFPTGGDDSYSRLFVFQPNGEEVVNELMFDDPLSLCFIRAYRYFLKCHQSPHAQQPPGMTLKFNEKTVALLEECKELARYQPHNSKITLIPTWKSVQEGVPSDGNAVLQ